jgi:hypothetical protein
VTISYEEFGRRFIEAVLTAERVEATLARVVAGAFDTSMRLAAGIVRAEGSGEVTRLEVDRLEGDPLEFRAQLFVRLELAVRISGVPHRYEGNARIELRLYPMLQDDLSIDVDIPDATAEDVTLDLRPLGRVAGLLDQVGSVAEQVEKEIARFVNTKKEDRAARAERRIEIVPVIEAEWERRASD